MVAKLTSVYIEGIPFSLSLTLFLCPSLSLYLACTLSISFSPPHTFSHPPPTLFLSRSHFLSFSLSLPHSLALLLSPSCLHFLFKSYVT